MILQIGCFLILFFLTGCYQQETYAPVVNAWQDPGVMKSRYRVQKDDTIYSIAWSFDLDYRDLAKANHLKPPYSLRPGQTLSMHISSTERSKDAEIESVNPVTFKDVGITNCPYQEINKEPKIVPEITLPELELKSVDKFDANIVEPPRKTVTLNQAKIVSPVNRARWQWPANGKVLKEFDLQGGGNKGIDITGNLGDPVTAAAPGKVVYSGSGLRGYGNLIIIKHSDNYLSAYAYNKKCLVKEGDVVRAGTEIGKMGQNNAGEVLLHFEIRRNGKPVNPLLYL